MVDEPEIEVPLTDLERFIELYRSFGIECIVDTQEDGTQTIDLLAGDSWMCKDGFTTSDKLVGYNGFYSRVCFDGDGVFIEQSFME